MLYPKLIKIKIASKVKIDLQGQAKTRFHLEMFGKGWSICSNLYAQVRTCSCFSANVAESWIFQPGSPLFLGPANVMPCPNAREPPVLAGIPACKAVIQKGIASVHHSSFL